MRASIIVLLNFAPLLLAAADSSPFAADFFTNSYWRDGKAEVSVYEAKELREGIVRSAEVYHIVVRETFSPAAMVKTDDWQAPGSYDVLKLNQILHVPVGTFDYYQMHSSFWRVENGQLFKFSLASIDSCGNTYKEGRIQAAKLTYLARTYWDHMDKVDMEIPLPEMALFYDELPLKLRSLNWEAVKTFSAELIPSVIGSKSDTLRAEPAEFSIEHQASAKAWQVRLTTSKGEDVFSFEDSYPFRLRDWKRADGSSLRLKSSVRIPYWKLNKPGDERYLSEPWQAVEELPTSNVQH